jgi:catechol 2,3-dioxygenase-like lactoylglutathione lyase family enzyme
MKPRIAGFELYFEDLEAARRFYRDTLGIELTDEEPGHHARFAAGGVFLCLERKGAESYPSCDKAVVFVETPDLKGMADRLGDRFLQFESGGPGPAWAVLHDPEGHNIVLIQSTGG